MTAIDPLPLAASIEEKSSHRNIFPASPPGNAERKMSKQHSLQPQIFLQLELTSPQGKPVDASMIDIISTSPLVTRKQSPQQEQRHCHPSDFRTHVRLEHCEGLPSEPTQIRNEDALDFPPLPDLDCSLHYRYDTESSKHTQSEDKAMASSPPVVSPIPRESPSLGAKPTLGCHDHLLKPLPQELFGAPDLTCTPKPQASPRRASKSAYSSPNFKRRVYEDELIFDATEMNLGIFDLISDDQANTPKSPRHLRSSSRRRRSAGTSVNKPENEKQNKRRDSTKTDKSASSSQKSTSTRISKKKGSSRGDHDSSSKDSRLRRRSGLTKSKSDRKLRSKKTRPERRRSVANDDINMNRSQRTPETSSKNEEESSSSGRRDSLLSSSRRKSRVDPRRHSRSSRNFSVTSTRREDLLLLSASTHHSKSSTSSQMRNTAPKKSRSLGSNARRLHLHKQGYPDDTEDLSEPSSSERHSEEFTVSSSTSGNRSNRSGNYHRRNTFTSVNMAGALVSPSPKSKNRQRLQHRGSLPLASEIHEICSIPLIANVPL